MTTKYFKSGKSQRQKEYIEKSQRGKHLSYHETKELNQISFLKPFKQKETEVKLSIFYTTVLEFCVKQNYHSKIKENKVFQQHSKIEVFIMSSPTLKEIIFIRKNVNDDVVN